MRAPYSAEARASIRTGILKGRRSTACRDIHRHVVRPLTRFGYAGVLQPAFRAPAVLGALYELLNGNPKLLSDAERRAVALAAGRVHALKVFIWREPELVERWITEARNRGT